MKYVLILCVFFCMQTQELICQTPAQTEKINCILFVDCRMPLDPTYGNIEYTDSLNKKQIIKFYYWTGVMHVTHEEFTKLYDLKDSDTIIISFVYTEYNKKNCKREDHQYSIDFRKGVLMYNDYLVFLINNIDKKKGIYRFTYRTGTLRCLDEHPDNKKLFQEFCGSLPTGAF